MARWKCVSIKDKTYTEKVRILNAFVKKYKLESDKSVLREANAVVLCCDTLYPECRYLFYSKEVTGDMEFVSLGCNNLGRME